MHKVHRRILEIAVEIKRICEKHDIKYFLIAGTLLGAVRHKGFIPWDDDMDIGLLREDYERFVDLCKTELSDQFELINEELPNYGLPFIKIQLKGTTFLEKSAPKYPCGNGIYVDCFPIDRMPDGKYKQMLQGKLLDFTRLAVLKKSGYAGLSNMRGIKRILNVYVALFSRKTLIKFMKHCCIRYNRCQTKFYVNSGSAYKYGKERFPAESLEGKLPEYQFETEILSCPKAVDEILTHTYGDYMQLPPEDKRYSRHGIIEIDLGE